MVCRRTGTGPERCPAHIQDLADYGKTYRLCRSASIALRILLIIHAIFVSLFQRSAIRHALGRVRLYHSVQDAHKSPMGSMPDNVSPRYHVAYREIQMSSDDASSEVGAMAAIEKAFAGLDKDAQGRVLRWAADRFGMTQMPTRVADKALVAPPAASVTEFSSLAELYGAADPATDAEKALVVGYWLQYVSGQQDLESQTINTELKQLGHGVGNITKALETLKERKPQLAVQTRKSGSTRQARKKYRITEEGRKVVQHMLNGGNEA